MCLIIGYEVGTPPKSILLFLLGNRVLINYALPRRPRQGSHDFHPEALQRVQTGQQS